EVHEDIGMHAWDGARRKGAAALAFAKLGIDPALVEELPDNRARFRAERIVAFLHEAACRQPIASGLIGKNRRIAIVIVELVETEDFLFETVIALHDAIILL